jgi:hypothetical protein
MCYEMNNCLSLYEACCNKQTPVPKYFNIFSSQSCVAILITPQSKVMQKLVLYKLVVYTALISKN